MFRRLFLAVAAIALCVSQAVAQFGTSKLTNNSGGTLAQYSIVVVDTSADLSFTTTTSARALGFIGVVWPAAGIADNATGLVALPGSYATVNVAGAVTRGDYLITSTTAGKAASGGTTDGTNAIGIALESGTDTAIDCSLFATAVTSAVSTTFDTEAELETALTDVTNVFTNNDQIGAANIDTGAVGSSELAATTVVAGAYTGADITIDADGRITAAANGAGVTTPIDTEAELEAVVGDVGNIFTDADGDALSGDHSLGANIWSPGANGLIFEGATANAYELYITLTDPATSDKTITFPNTTGTVALLGDFAAPPTIGGTTPGLGTFTTLTSTLNTVVGGKLQLEGNLVYDEGTAENAIWQQNTSATTASRYYLIPKGDPTGTSSSLKLFATDWVADATNYADFNISVTDAMTDISASGYSVMLNSKVNGSITDPMDIAFVFQDGAEIAGRIIYNGGDSGWIFGSGATNYMSTHSSAQFTLDALMMNDKGIRWRNAAGTANSIIKINSSDQLALTVNGSAAGTISAAGAIFPGPISCSTVTTFTANDTTPSVAAGNTFVIPGTWTAGNNITFFDGGATGQIIVVHGGDADCDIVPNVTTMFLESAATWDGAANATIVLQFNGTKWIELARNTTSGGV